LWGLLNRVNSHFKGIAQFAYTQKGKRP
jgi:hypothetical protein